MLNIQRYGLHLPFKRKIVHFGAKFPWLFIQPYQLSFSFCSLLFHGHCRVFSSSCQGLELGFVAYRFIEHMMFSPHMRHCVFLCKSLEVLTANILLFKQETHCTVSFKKCRCLTFIIKILFNQMFSPNSHHVVASRMMLYTIISQYSWQILLFICVYSGIFGRFRLWFFFDLI